MFVALSQVVGVRQSVVDRSRDRRVVRGIVSETLLDMHNLVSFEITGRLWAQPYPIELLLRTNVDLETGAAQVTEATQSQRSEG